MLKGHVSIELKDVNTGKIQHLEKDNLVTSAIPRLLNILGQNNLGQTKQPIATELLNGLLVFSENVSESVDNVCPTNTVLAVGNKNTYSQPEYGSYNTVESGKTETGYKHVWDFTTSQCNGTIYALSLTHHLGANSVMSQPQSVGGSMGITILNLPSLYHAPLYIDYATNTIYYAILQSYTVKIYSCRFAEHHVKLNDKFGKIDFNDFTLITEYENLFSSHDLYLIQDVAGRKTYIYSTAPTNNIPVAVFDWDTLSTTSQTLVLYRNKSGSNYSRKMGIYNGYVYFYSTDTDCICRQKIGDTSDYYEYTDLRIHGYSSGTSLYYIGHGDPSRFYIGVGSLAYLYIINPLTNEHTYAQDQYDLLCRYMRVGDHFLNTESGFNSGGNSDVIVPNLRYLATIFNLASPITKTASQTMKIIYTLTDAGNE